MIKFDCTDEISKVSRRDLIKPITAIMLNCFQDAINVNILNSSFVPHQFNIFEAFCKEINLLIF